MKLLSLPLLLLLPSSVFAATGYTHPPSSARALGHRGLVVEKRWPKPVSTNPSVSIQGDVCTVTPLGGGKDDGPNLLYAFSACNNYSLINLPGYYTVNTVLKTNLTNVEINLTGAISYTPNIAYWSPNSIYLTYQNATTYWFFSGSGITLHGGGTINANGQTWWSYFALNPTAGVAGGSSTVFARPVPLTVGNASNVVVDGISIINSPFWHNFVYQSTDVTYKNIQISSISFNTSAPSANSDGWDIYRSSFINIIDSNIQNNDDCVSFKPNSTNILVANLICNGSHGISVGSLGQYAGEVDIVENVLVKNISMSNAQNGARIKVFGGSNNTKSQSGGGTGYVRNVTFSDFVNNKVDNPIFLTQCYNGNTAGCIANPSTLSISDIHYINVTGSSSGKASPSNAVVTLECSAECQNITAKGTKLVTSNGTKAEYLCANIASESMLDFNCTEVSI